jgi:acetylornithine deacetylase/succinyl-diaminopimelate desuccinylase-like protein
MRTVNPPGDEAPLAAYFVELLREAGLEARVIPTPAGDSRAGRAAAWGRLRGTGERRPLVLLSHLDVVTADPRAWSSDPFAGAVQGGYVVGRGAQDAKGVAVVQLLALIERARRGPPPRRDIVFLATPDEESGGLDGAAWVTRERPELLDDAAYLLTEGGGVQLGRGGVPSWQVAITEKSPCWLRVIAEGTPGHGAVPPADAAVPRLLDALQRARALERPIRVVPAVARMFAALAPLAPDADAAGFADLGRYLATDPDFRSRFLSEPAYAALVRDTLAVTVLEGSPRTNVLATRAQAHLDARLLPGSRCEAFTRQIQERVAGPGVSVETLLSLTGLSSPVDTPLYRAIQAVAADRDPRAVVVPRVVAGFTDAHYFRARGLVAYGFVPRWHRVGEARGVHGPDERISLDNLERGVETLVAILDELDRQE